MERTSHFQGSHISHRGKPEQRGRGTERHQEQGTQLVWGLPRDWNWKTRTSITTGPQKGLRWDHQRHKRMSCIPRAKVKFWLKRLTQNSTEYSEPARHSVEKCQCTRRMQGAARSAERLHPTACTIYWGQVFHKPETCHTELFNQTTVILGVSTFSTAPSKGVSLSHCLLSRSDWALHTWLQRDSNQVFV